MSYLVSARGRGEPAPKGPAHRRGREKRETQSAQECGRGRSGSSAVPLPLRRALAAPILVHRVPAHRGRGAYGHAHRVHRAARGGDVHGLALGPNLDLEDGALRKKCELGFVFFCSFLSFLDSHLLFGNATHTDRLMMGQQGDRE